MLPAGQQFMIDLLVESLMADRGLEEALVAAIANEMADRVCVSPSWGQEGGGEGGGGGENVPLFHLVRQLLSNTTGRQLSMLKQVYTVQILTV